MTNVTRTHRPAKVNETECGGRQDGVGAASTHGTKRRRAKAGAQQKTGTRRTRNQWNKAKELTDKGRKGTGRRHRAQHGQGTHVAATTGSRETEQERTGKRNAGAGAAHNSGKPPAAGRTAATRRRTDPGPARGADRRRAAAWGGRGSGRRQVLGEEKDLPQRGGGRAKGTEANGIGIKQDGPALGKNEKGRRRGRESGRRRKAAPTRNSGAGGERGSSKKYTGSKTELCWEWGGEGQRSLGGNGDGSEEERGSLGAAEGKGH